MLLENKIETNRTEILNHLARFIATNEQIDSSARSRIERRFQTFPLETSKIKYDNYVRLYGDKRVISVDEYFYNIVDGSGRPIFDEWFATLYEIELENVIEAYTFNSNKILISKDGKLLFKKPAVQVTCIGKKCAIICFAHEDSYYYAIIDSSGNVLSDELYSFAEEAGVVVIKSDHVKAIRFIRVKKGKLWNVLSSENNFQPISKVWYKSIENTESHGYFIVSQNFPRANILNYKGGLVSKTWFDDISFYTVQINRKKYFRVGINNLYNLMCTDGTFFFEEWVNGFEKLNNNPNDKLLFKIRLENGQENFIDRNGKKAFPFNFDSIYDYGSQGSMNYIIVLRQKNGVFYSNMIDYNANLILPSWVIDNQHNRGLLYAISNNRVGLESVIDKFIKNGHEMEMLKEERIINKENIARSFASWLCRHFKDDKYLSQAYLDTLLPEIHFSPYFNGLRIVELMNNYNIIKTNGELLFDDWFAEIHKGDEIRPSIVDVYATGATNGDQRYKQNLLSPTGKILLSKNVSEIINGGVGNYFLVYDSSGYNLVDNNGETMLDQWFNWIGDFKNGFARVERSDGKENLIDIDGNFLLDRWHDEIIRITVPDHVIVRIGSRLNAINLKTQKYISSLWFNNMRCIRHFSNDAVLTYLFEVGINYQYNILKLDGNLLCDNWYSRIRILLINNVLALVENNGAQVGSTSKNKIGCNLIDYNGNEILKYYVDGLASCFENGDCILEKRIGEKIYNTIVDCNGNQLNDWTEKANECYAIGNARSNQN